MPQHWPAMRLAIGIAGGCDGWNSSNNGSGGNSVILCTDGLGNQGLGSLEGEDDNGTNNNNNNFVAFYIECVKQALLKDVSVSVVTIAWTEACGSVGRWQTRQNSVCGW